MDLLHQVIKVTNSSSSHFVCSLLLLSDLMISWAGGCRGSCFALKHWGPWPKRPDNMNWEVLTPIFFMSFFAFSPSLLGLYGTLEHPCD
ncbi:hypothetical protein B0H10DRAFT_734187 [Mycena sp. CBHHK59/15]|nr:hypothetical protein B0H10DRAFT_734187 [Mycena sp. CBHHK59/15]